MGELKYFINPTVPRAESWDTSEEKMTDEPIGETHNCVSKCFDSPRSVRSGVAHLYKYSVGGGIRREERLMDSGSA